MRKLIKVTNNNIKQGHRNSPSSCPIALALRREFPLISHRISVGLYYANFDFASHKLPRSAKRFIKNFDTKGKCRVKPFNFYLNIKE